MAQGFALDFRGDRRSADKALWRHLYDLASAEVGGEVVEDMRVAWVVHWTERDASTGVFLDAGTYTICATEWNAFTVAKMLRSNATRGMSYEVRRTVFPAGRLSKSIRFRGYRQVLGGRIRSELLSHHDKTEILRDDPKAKFVRCYLKMPEGQKVGSLR